MKSFWKEGKNGAVEPFQLLSTLFALAGNDLPLHLPKLSHMAVLQELDLILKRNSTIYCDLLSEAFNRYWFPNHLGVSVRIILR